MRAVAIYICLVLVSFWTNVQASSTAAARATATAEHEQTLISVGVFLGQHFQERVPNGTISTSDYNREMVEARKVKLQGWRLDFFDVVIV